MIIRTQAPRIENWIGNTQLADWLKVLVYQSVGLLVTVVLSYLLAYITFETIEKHFRPTLYSKL